MIKFMMFKALNAYEFTDNTGVHWRFVEGAPWQMEIGDAWHPAEYYTGELEDAFSELWRKQHGYQNHGDSPAPNPPSND